MPKKNTRRREATDKFLQVSLPFELWKSLRIRAMIEDETVSDLCREILQEAIDKKVT